MKPPIQDWPPVGAVAGYFPDLPPPPASLGTLAAVPVHVPPPNKPKEMRGARAAPRGHDGQYGCRVPADGTKRCPQCWGIQKWPDAFDGKLNCNACRRSMCRAGKAAP